MEDNKLRDEIEQIVNEIEYSGTDEPIDKLYSLTADVAVKFAVYCRLEHPLVHGYDNGQLDTIFTNFITHIYQPK